MNLTTLKTVINNEQNRSYMSYKSNGLPLTCFTCFWYVHVTHFIHDCWYFMVSLDLIWLDKKNLLYRSVVIRGLVCALSHFIYFCFLIFFVWFLFSLLSLKFIYGHILNIVYNTAFIKRDVISTCDFYLPVLFFVKKNILMLVCQFFNFFFKHADFQKKKF